MKPSFLVLKLRSGRGVEISAGDGSSALLFVKKVHDEADRVQLLFHSTDGRVQAERLEVTLSEFIDACPSQP